MTAAVSLSRKNRKQKSKSFFRQNLKTIKLNDLIAFLAAIAIIMTIIAGSYYLLAADKSLPASSQTVSSPVPWFKWQDILFAGIPGLSASLESNSPIKISSQINAKKIACQLIFFLTNIDLNDRYSFLSQELPFFTIVKTASTSSALNTGSYDRSTSGPTIPNTFYPDDPSQKAAKLSDKPLVGIYHTHTSESFVPSAGVSHKPGGQLGDIGALGEVFVKELEKRKIISVHSKKIHDFPSFMKAYGESEITIRKMLADNPSIQILLDIHRDAAKRQDSIININGAEFAKISIVVATGQEDLPQPLWLQNHAFAKLLDAKLTIRYPGLSKGIQLSEWRYNQHLHPRALLIEVGCQENSIEEASRSMASLAEIIAEILKEGLR